MKTEIYQYNNNPVSFQLEGNGDIMISASQMAKPFGKLPADWLRTKQSKEFLDAKATMGNHIVTDLVVVINGGDGRGTFMHEELGMSAKTLNRILKEKGVQYKQGGQWLLKHKYQNRGYTKTHTHHFTRNNGEVGTIMSTVWTEKGREWIHSLQKLKH